jgi:hypothetical protein
MQFMTVLQKINAVISVVSVATSLVAPTEAAIIGPKAGPAKLNHVLNATQAALSVAGVFTTPEFWNTSLVPIIQSSVNATVAANNLNGTFSTSQPAVTSPVSGK